MLEIMGVKFITDKEASERYGYSQSWFQRARLDKKGPPWVKIMGKGKVLYRLEDCDQWFKDNIVESERWM